MHVCVCAIYFQRRADAAGLRGDAARPRRKAEDEACGDTEATEGGGGIWSGLLRRRRGQGGATGGLG